jgi:hypothetical protein
MSFVPQPGDFIIINRNDFLFEVADCDGRVIAGPFPTLAAAVANVRFQSSDRIGIWQQRLDEQGTPLGPPGILLPRRSLGAQT